MHTRVNRSQFEINDTTVVHTPTGAEFTPQAGDSVIVWTGDIGVAQRRHLSVQRRAQYDENSLA
jgi:hypothetical protein